MLASRPSPVPRCSPLQCSPAAATLTAKVMPGPLRRRCRAASRRAHPTQQIWRTWTSFHPSKVAWKILIFAALVTRGTVVLDKPMFSSSVPLGGGLLSRVRRVKNRFLDGREVICSKIKQVERSSL